MTQIIDPIGPQWQYQLVTIDEDRELTEATLNLFGANGWELVSSDQTTKIYTLKRKVKILGW